MQQQPARSGSLEHLGGPPQRLIVLAYSAITLRLTS